MTQHDCGLDWEIDLSSFTKNYQANHQLIKLANQKNSLLSLLHQYQIVIDTTYTTPSGWCNSVCCPFPDHKEKTPSFGYNLLQDCFNCFGCHRGGQAVQFLSTILNIDLTAAAEKLLQSSSEEIINQILENDEENILEVLIDFSNESRKFLDKHTSNLKAIKYLDSITWNLDIYLRRYLLSGKVKHNQLYARVEKLKDRLLNFGE